MPRVVDLSTPIRSDHFRWPVRRELRRTHEKDGVQVTWLGTVVHGFTHIDAPRHFEPEGATSDQLDLNTVVGEAAIVDVRRVGADSPIKAEHLRAAGGHVRDGDIVLVRAGWDEVESVDEPAFWARSPWMTPEAAEWLLGKNVRAVGFDFPQDRCIRNFLTGAPNGTYEEHVTHYVLLRRGVILMEYLCNLAALRGDRTYLVALPLKLPQADGAPARIIALEDMPGVAAPG